MHSTSMLAFLDNQTDDGKPFGLQLNKAQIRGKSYQTGQGKTWAKQWKPESKMTSCESPKMHMMES